MIFSIFTCVISTDLFGRSVFLRCKMNEILALLSRFGIWVTNLQVPYCISEIENL